jgi:hypothetical protein
MRQIHLTQGLVALVDDADYDELNQHKWHAHRSGNGWYAQRHGFRGNKRCILHMHREVMLPPDAMQVDHANGNGLDNQRSNLRICTHAENVRNGRKRRPGSSRFRGVTHNKRLGKWVAQICVNFQKMHLGVFDTEREAAFEYALAALVHFGAFTPINDVEFAGLVV